MRKRVFGTDVAVRGLGPDPENFWRDLEEALGGWRDRSSRKYWLQTRCHLDPLLRKYLRNDDRKSKPLPRKYDILQIFITTNHAQRDSHLFLHLHNV